MSKKTNPKKRNPKREQFRADLMARIAENWGDIGDAVSACGISRPTAHRWQKTGYSLPDAYQLSQIAASRKISPAWLAFGLGPRNLVAVQRAFELGSKFEETPGLMELLEGYIRAKEEDRAVLRHLAGKV